MAVIFQPDRILLRKQIKKFSHYIHGVVLDVGAGGFDRYSDLFSYEKYLRLDVNPEYKPDIVASAENIPLKDNSVDSVVCAGVLSDIENFTQVIKEFFRVLKPGGAVLLTEYLICQIHDEPNDFWRFTNFGLETIFRRAGFEIIAIDQRGGFFCTLAQMNVRYLIDRFSLYAHEWGRLFNPFFKLFFYLCVFLDRIDKSRANRTNALGWLVVAKKGATVCN